MSTRDLRIDAARTLAITLMVFYHLAYDLVTFAGWELDVFSGGWKMLARASLTLFLILSGMSQALSHKAKGPEIRWKRFGQIAAAAALVSIGTYVMDPDSYVRFGVLHLIAVSVLLLPFFARFQFWNVLIGMGLVMLEIFSPFIPLHSAFLIPFGFPQVGFETVDYVPMIPWFGVILLGYALGYTWVPKAESNVWLERLTWPGRHSLLIYLVHQPILMAVVFALHP